MDIIYAPKGKAREYADLAMDIYKGCTHGCIYCYATHYAGDGFYQAAAPRRDLIDRLRGDVAQLAPDCPEILLSFHGDVYQPAEDKLQLTRQALQAASGCGSAVCRTDKRRAARDPGF
ncbi:MAG: hypothetical protein R2861_10405 [Desulfobacterales bacterium]